MARIMIRKQDGSSSRYFWSDSDNDSARKTVYKQTTDGIKRMKGVHYDASSNRIIKQ